MNFDRRLLRWTHLTLAAAGIIGTHQLATAQQRPVTRSATGQVTVKAGRQAQPDTAMEVEVAWLAEPGLFSCHLQAKATADGMELTGYLPNEHLKQKAMQIAKTQFDGKITDKLHVQVGMPVAASRASAPAELAQAATTYMTENLGDKILGLQMTCPTPGRIELTGTVVSAADKLEISKTLRGLSGCTHVVNRATVGSVNVAVTKAPPPQPAAPSPIPAPTPARATVQVQATVPATAPKPVPVAITRAAPPIVTPKASAIVDTTGPALAAAPAVVVPVNPKPPQGGVMVISAPRTTPMRVERYASEPIVEGPALAANLAPTRMDNRAEAGHAVVIVPPSIEQGPSLGNPTVEPMPVAVVKREIEAVPPPTLLLPAPRNFTPPIKPVEVGTTPKISTSTPAPTAVAELRLPPVDSRTVEVINPPMIEQPKPIEVTASVPTVEAPKPVQVAVNVPVIEAPKPVEVPKANSAPMVETPMPVQIAVKAPIVEAPKAVEMPKAIPAPVVETPKPVEVVTASPTVQAPIIETKPAPLVETPKPAEIVKPVEVVKAVEPTTGFAERRMPKQGDPRSMPRMSSENIAPMAAATPNFAKLQPIPSMEPSVEPTKKIVSAPTGPVVSQVSFTDKSAPANGKANDLISDNLMGVLRAPEAANKTVTDTEAARTAIETTCKSACTSSDVRVAGNRQITLTLKMKDATEWAMLQPRLKALPEAAGYSMIYRVSVGESSAASATASAKAGSSAPMMGVIRGRGTGHAAEPDAVRKVIEEVCRSCSQDLSVRPTGSRQVAIAMKVSNSADWDQIYAKIRQLPEIADYAVIFNVQVR